jgi:hypothetical protein
MPGHDGRTTVAGKDERGDMTRLRGALPPVVSVMSPPTGRPRAGSVLPVADEADREL